MKSSDQVLEAIKADNMTVGEFEDWISLMMQDALAHAGIDPDPNFKLTLEEETSLEEISKQLEGKTTEELEAVGVLISDEDMQSEDHLLKLLGQESHAFLVEELGSEEYREMLRRMRPDEEKS